MSKEGQQKTMAKANAVVAECKQFEGDLIVLDRDGHLLLLSAGGMTDRQMLAQHSTTLAKLTANLAPDCAIGKVKVAIKGQEVERHSGQADRLPQNCFPVQKQSAEEVV
jgi:hypothetical protein